MQKINILDSRVYNRIAAGEVVERPSSIVKELVENSIDAGATHVVIEIEEGGIKKIQVSDNGCGIYFDDLKSAFLPHATSKIKDISDLDSIKTLGFRGEALASIGSVAETTIISKTKDSEVGGKIETNGGVIGKPIEVSSADGTFITVKNLFFNIPARAKFLKKPKTEESYITDIVSRFILANPFVSIKYIADGKQIYFSTGKGKDDAVFAVYGKEGINNLIPINFDYGSIKISGFTAKPTFSKPNKTYETLIVNGRYVINSTVATAVYNAYQGYLMKHQFPFFILYLDIDYSAVDVNVHPNKLDIKFENSGNIYRLVFESITRTICDLRVIPNASEESNISIGYNDKIQLMASSEKTSIEHTAKNELGYKNDALYLESNDTNLISSTEKPKLVVTEKQRVEALNKLFIETSEDTTSEIVIPPKFNSENNVNKFSAINMLTDGDKVSDSVNFSSKLLDKLSLKYEQEMKNEQIEDLSIATVDPIVIGKLFNTYLLVEFESSFIIVDQHAAHERLLFEKLKKEVDSGSVMMQDLIVPYVLKLNPIETEFFDRNIDSLKELGFDIEQFGTNTYRVTGIPFLFADIKIKEFFDYVLADLKNLKSLTQSDLIRDSLARHACRSAVKGGDSLKLEEIKYLLKDISKDKIVLLCPHGRPIAIRITKSEIEKWFKRIV